MKSLHDTPEALVAGLRRYIADAGSAESDYAMQAGETDSDLLEVSVSPQNPAAVSILVRFNGPRFPIDVYLGDEMHFELQPDTDICVDLKTLVTAAVQGRLAETRVVGADGEVLHVEGEVLGDPPISFLRKSDSSGTGSWRRLSYAPWSVTSNE